MRDTDGDGWAALLTWEDVGVPLDRRGSKTRGKSMNGAKRSNRISLNVAVALRAGVGKVNEEERDDCFSRRSSLVRRPEVSP